MAGALADHTSRPDTTESPTLTRSARMASMSTSNPVLQEKVFARELEASGRTGYAPRTATPTVAPSGPGQSPTPAATTGPFAEGPVGAGTPPGGATAVDDVMRVGGVASATMFLAVVLFIAAFFGWNAVQISTTTDLTGATVVASTRIPGWLWPAWIVGLVLAIVTVVKPKIARYTANLYVIAQGLLMGAISKIFDVQYSGIVLQALFLTGAVFVVMLGLFVTRMIRVTERLRTGVIVATVAVLGVYLVSWILSFVGVENPAVFSSGPMGIVFSLVVVGIAVFNLLLDFDFVERAVAAQAPRYLEWYAAFGLMVTLIWLYLELLRLLAKLRE